MPNNIDNLVSHVNRMYPAKPWNYEVSIFGPGIVKDASPELMLQCSGVNVPGVNIGITQERRYGIGHLKSLPLTKSYTEVTMTFYEGENELEREFFVNWMDLIYNKERNRFSFFNDIVKTIQIVQFDKTKNKSYECYLYEAFPSNVSPLDKAYSSSDTAPQFTVNFQFYETKETFYDGQEDTTRPIGIFSSLFGL